MNQLNQQLRLPGGRRLGYDEYGSPDGQPVFYLHGSPSARVEFGLFGSQALVRSLGARLIAVDRPGIGLSDYQANRRLLDFPQDLLALADHLKLARFAVLSYSLGGPYGMACAYAIPERLTRVGIVSGAAFFSRPELMAGVNQGTQTFLSLPRTNPFAASLFLWSMSAMARFAPGMITRSAASMLPEPDRPVVADPEIQKRFIGMLREAFRQGSRGVSRDALLSGMDYGFRLEEIRLPVLLWHGEADENIPLAMARYVSSSLPACQAAFYQNEGHLSLFKKNVAAIIQALVA